MWYDDNDYVLSSIKQHFGLPPDGSTTTIEGREKGLSFDDDVGADANPSSMGTFDEGEDQWSAQYRTSCASVLHVDASPTFLKMDDVLSHSISMRISGGAIPIGPSQCDYSFAGNATSSSPSLPPPSAVAPEPPFLRRGIIVDWIFRTARKLTDPELKSLFSQQEEDDDEGIDEPVVEGPVSTEAVSPRDDGVVDDEVLSSGTVVDVDAAEKDKAKKRRRRDRRPRARKPRARDRRTRTDRGVAKDLGDGWVIDNKGVRRNPRGDVERLRRKREEEKRQKEEERARRGMESEEEGGVVVITIPHPLPQGCATPTVAPLDGGRGEDGHRDRHLAFAQVLRQRRERAVASGPSPPCPLSASSHRPSSSRPMRAAKALAIKELSLGDPFAYPPVRRAAPTTEQRRSRSSPYPSRAGASGL